MRGRERGLSVLILINLNSLPYEVRCKLDTSPCVVYVLLNYLFQFVSMLDCLGRLCFHFISVYPFPGVISCLSRDDLYGVV